MTDTPQIDVDKEIAARFAVLPKVVQDAITSADVQKRLRELADGHRLHLDQWQTLENEVMLTLLGIQEIGGLAQEIQTEVGISQEEATALTRDINKIVFEPIRAELERLLDNPEAQEKKLTAIEVSRQQELASNAAESTASAPIPAPIQPAILPATPPTPAPTEKAVRAPISGSYHAQEPSSARKSIEGDPYREPPK